MKLKKLLASILCVAMVLSTMSISVFAEATVITLDEFVTLLENGNGVYDGNGITVKFTANNADTTFYNQPDTFNQAGGKVVQYYGLFGKWNGWTSNSLADLTISNVNFVFDNTDCINPNNSNEITTAEFTLWSVGDINFTNCSFDSVSVDCAAGMGTDGLPQSATFSGCTFKNIENRNPIHQCQAKVIKVDGCIFENCDKAIHFNSAELESITITNNTLINVGNGIDSLITVGERNNFSVAVLSMSDNTITYDDGATKANGVFNLSYNATLDEDSVVAMEETNDFGELNAVKSTGTITLGFTNNTSVWGEGGANAKESFVVELYADDVKIAQASLNDYEDIIDGDLYVTWSIPFNGQDSNYWEVEWYGNAPYVDIVPTKVVLVVDGIKVAENEVQMNGPDNLWPVKWDELENVPAAAKLGKKRFGTIQAAVNAAVEGDNEIVILPGTYDESFMVNQAPGKNITITAENKGDVTLTGTISVNGNRSQNGAETLTISNLVFDGSNKTAAHNFIVDSNGTPNYPTYAHNVTVKNCDFIGNDDMAAPVVAFREAKGGSNNIVFDGVTATDIHSLMQVSSSLKLTVKNSTLTNLGEGAVNATGTSEVIFTNNVVDVKEYAVRTGQNNSSTNTVANITMNGNTIASGVTALAMRNATTTAVMTNNSIVAPAAYTAENADASTINGVAITADEIDAAVNDNNAVIPESMTISFVQDEPGLYNIVITATDDIYEFVGAELTFANTSKTVAGEDMNYEILGISGTTNAEKSIEKADTYALRLVDGAERMSGKDLVIGQVKFHGQGDINFTVSEGKVVTTEYGTNLGQYYTLDADDTTADTLTVNAITNGAVEEVTRDVVVNVAYKHALDGTYWNDNKITVTLKDGFGNIYGPFDVSDEIETIPDVKLGRLTVTLEAPGFRKYVYNTTLEAGADENDALVLNFWNDIKRNTVQSPLAEIEAGVSGETNKNFVVGDIVMDYTVDEYDLAAVTSYYGMYELEDADKYIKYDLNRDGNIDIIDVHYVLHTLNN